MEEVSKLRLVNEGSDTDIDDVENVFTERFLMHVISTVNTGLEPPIQSLAFSGSNDSATLAVN
ncbi:hypothetical protein F441_18368 [Phytophthora nicotianae CJ01A1]|uniref:Uncharacterized protein n=1 Tax=Phytophthora nicotianae CJ01A1 TaxID=1317063 RepID=W2W323_PHYNI|nr:hypothetical protein F441_18368 [Phytophthora nicotianae CJ01A1]